MASTARKTITFQQPTTLADGKVEIDLGVDQAGHENPDWVIRHLLSELYTAVGDVLDQRVGPLDGVGPRTEQSLAELREELADRLR